MMYSTQHEADVAGTIRGEGLSSIKVNIAVCGRFHYHHYVSYIDKAGALGRFYYAHRVSTDASFLQIDARRAVNIWIKEYLIHCHNRLAPKLPVAALYHELWQQLVVMQWKPCDLFHFMLHGNCLKIVRLARARGSIIVGEPVNSHPRTFTGLLNDEHDRLGVAGHIDIAAYEEHLNETSHCDYLLAGSEFVKQSYVDNGFDPAKAFVIRYGADLRNFYPLSDDERRGADSTFRVICVADVTPRKGHLYLLEAWRQLKLPNAELLLVGDIKPSMAPILKRYAGEFKHIAKVANRQLREYYGRSSVFVLPSVEDGFAYVCTEAMACGLPVITTTNTGAAELIEHGKNGFVVPIRSPEAIAEKLQLLYCDAELRRQMGQAAFSTSTAALGWARYAGRLESLYGRLLS